jgi:hypothetical protein
VGHSTLQAAAALMKANLATKVQMPGVQMTGADMRTMRAALKRLADPEVEPAAEGHVWLGGKDAAARERARRHAPQPKVYTPHVEEHKPPVATAESIQDAVCSKASA